MVVELARSCLVTMALGALLAASPASAAVPAQVSIGFRFACAVGTGGGVECWGANDFGKLGDGTTEYRLDPVPVVGLASGVASVDGGENHACVVTTTGGVKCWGRNADGELGDGTTTGSTTPVDVSGLASGVAAVSASRDVCNLGVSRPSTCALTTSGGVKCWGNNAHGQLGDGTTTSSSTPVDVSGLASGVAAISAGGCHTCALTTGGGVKCWGMNGFGQLGDGTTVDSSTPVDVAGLTSGVVAVAAGTSSPASGDYTCALTAAGGVECWGGFGTFGPTTPVDVPSLTSGVGAISVGDRVCASFSGSGVRCLTNFGGNWLETYAYEDGSLTAIEAGPSDAYAPGLCMITTADDLRCLRPSTGGGPDFIPQCIPGFGDTDRDRLCDAYDRCTDAPGTAIFRGQLTAVRTQDAAAGNEGLTLTAKFHLPAGVAFGDLDPLADGASVVFFDTHGVILELPLQPGAFGGVGTAGWQLAGKTWRFLDRSAGGGAVTRLTLSDRGKGLPGGMVQLALRTSPASVPIGPHDTGPRQRDLGVGVVLGDASAGAAGLCTQQVCHPLVNFQPLACTIR